MNQSSSNAVRRPMPATGAKQMSAAAHQQQPQPQQSIQIPIVTFASIVPIPDGRLTASERFRLFIKVLSQKFHY